MCCRCPGCGPCSYTSGSTTFSSRPGRPIPRSSWLYYRQLVLRGRGAGLRVVGATVTPFEGWARWTPALDEVRQRINAAVRTGRVFDAVADFDAAVRDPDRPSRMLPAYDSGDGLHPNPSGHAALAAAVDRRHLL